MKKLISFILCLCVISAFCITASADSKPVITISNVSANNGEEVAVDISISNNPGIMAMAFCITYDSSALEYTGYDKGYLSKYTVKDHSDQGHVSFVNDESSDKATDGVIISVKFKIKSDASPKKYAISIENLNRQKYGSKLYKSFSNSKLESIEPSVISGNVTVNETCENSGHNYGDWTITTPADCTNTGIKSRDCLRCYTTQNALIPVTHDFEADWTIDKAATPEEDGEMSRHCTLCDAVTDKITFSYEEIGDDTSSDSTDSDIESDVSKDENSSSGVDSSKNENSSSNQTNNNNKPNIDNTVGEKVPQQEAEKLENYQPPKEENDDSSEIILPEDTNETPEDENSSIDNNVTATDTNTNNSTQESSFFDTPLNLALVIIGTVLVVGIILLCIVIIARRKK